MIPGFVLSLREGLEAALIIGIALGVLRKLGRQSLNSMIWIGALSAIIVSILTAVGLNWIGAEFTGRGEQLFEGITMFLAAGVLTWMVFWMRKQSKTIRADVEEGVSLAIQGKGKRALFFLAFLAVVREGIELGLFLLAARLNSNPFQELLGAALGLSSAALLGWVIFTASRRLSLGKFFQSTNVLLALFAAGLVGLGVREFNEIGWIPSIIDHVWDLGRILPDDSTVGQLLKALIGYNSNPSLSQVIAYFGYFVVLGGILVANRKISPLSEAAKNK
jgi:high-affinity iron transporter